MDIPNAKAYLEQLKDLNRTIQRNLERLYELRESMYCLGGLDCKDKVQTTPNPHKIGSIVAKIVDLEKETDVLVDSYADIAVNMNALIQNVCTDQEEKVLHELYFEHKSISEASEKLDMSPSTIKRTRRKATYKVAEEMKTQNIVFGVD